MEIVVNAIDWNNKDKEELRKWLVDTLNDSCLTITFTKTDGTERVMKCTLNSDVIVPYQQKTDRKKSANDQLISVWDIENSGWRSFKIDNIKNIQGVI